MTDIDRPGGRVHAAVGHGTEFADAGTVDGIPLVSHRCSVYQPGGVVYVSPAPSQPSDEYMVPGCGCRPGGAE